jgi:hypothetical protein
MRITGMAASDFSQSAILENAADYIVSHLSVSPDTLNDRQLSLCEYAAAAVAVYDYSFELCIKKLPVMSENGEVSVQREDSALIDKARILRKNALDGLAAAGLSQLSDFAFMGV